MAYNPVPVPMVGSLIVFKKGVSKTEVIEALRKIDHLIEYHDTQDFDAAWGWPVFYIP